MTGFMATIIMLCQFHGTYEYNYRDIQKKEHDCQVEYIKCYQNKSNMTMSGDQVLSICVLEYSVK